MLKTALSACRFLAGKGAPALRFCSSSRRLWRSAKPKGVAAYKYKGSRLLKGRNQPSRDFLIRTERVIAHHPVSPAKHQFLLRGAYPHISARSAH
jgi:hypothetical protein